MQKIDFINAVSRFEYIVNMMYKEQILLMKKQILSMQKKRFDYCEIMKKQTDSAFKSIQIWFLNLENTIARGVL